MFPLIVKTPATAVTVVEVELVFLFYTSRRSSPTELQQFVVRLDRRLIRQLNYSTSLVSIWKPGLFGS